MRFNISVKIVALILLASFIPLLIYTSFTVIELNNLENNIITSTSETTLNSLKNHTMQIINITENQVSGIIEEDLQTLKTLAYSMAKPLSEGNLELLKWLEYGVNEVNPSIGGIWVVNTSNIIVSGSEHPYFPIGMDLTDDPIHQAMLTLVDQGYNETNYPLITFNPWPVGEGEYGMGYNYPIFYNGTYIGVLIMTREWIQFQELITTTKIKESVNLMLVNLDGDIIAGIYGNETEPYSANFFALNPEYNSSNSILERDSGIQEGMIDDVEVIFCYKWIDEVNNKWMEAITFNNSLQGIQVRNYLEERIAGRWAVLTVFPLEEFMQPVEIIEIEVHDQADTFSLTALISFILIGLLGLGFAYFGTRWFTTPIIMLTEATEKIGRGDLDTRVNISSKDEIGELTRSFNQMAMNLVQKGEALRKSEERYREAYKRAMEQRERAEAAEKREREESANKSLLLANISNEIRIPLKLMSENLNSLYETRISGEQTNWVNKIKAINVKLLDLVTGVLELQVPSEISTINVLCVDDEPAIVNLLKISLEKEDERLVVDTSSSVHEGLQKLEEEDFDAIVSDYEMLEMNGLEFLEELRNKGEKIPFIIFTGRGREEVAIKALNLGANRYIQKGGDPKSQYSILTKAIVSEVEHRRVEESLRQTEARFRMIFENTATGMVRVDVKGHILETNIAFDRFLGYNPEELHGLHFLEATHSEDKELSIGYFQQLVSGEIDDYSIETRFIRKNSNIVCGRVTGSLVRYSDREPLYVIGTVVDITEKKKAEKDLREEKEKFQNYLDIAGVMLMTLNRDGNIELINKRGCEILGYSEEEIIAKNWFDNFLPERMKKEVKEVFKSFIDLTIEPVGYYENPILTKQGEERTIAWYNTLLTDEKDGVIAIIRSGEDITERKQLQEEILEKNKLAAVGELAAGIAHELNTPLMNIDLTIEYIVNLVEREQPVDKELLKPEFEVIQKLVQYCANIIKELLQFSRKIDLVETKFPVKPFINEIGNFPVTITRMRETGIEMHVEVDEDFEITADRNLLLQVFQNLVNNAIDALSEVSRKPMIRITSMIDESEVVIRVIDNGEGVQEEDISKVFDPFFTTKYGEGTGLGLSICKSIVEKHGGKISIKSTIGKGTEVKVKLPVN
ncbi:MAG: PAS domain S-box protein [Candidatus Hodarchaeales archaeon]|jgi:PAS domain S-box-containing protein